LIDPKEVLKNAAQRHQTDTLVDYGIIQE
jgi:hypothetical protein